MNDWRKLAHDDAESEEAAESREEPKFDHPEREGADALKKADYEEVEAFEKPLLDLLKTGKVPGAFCCATCEYYMHDESKLKGGWCEELSAEDSPAGCCRYWDFNKSGKIKEKGDEG